MILASHQPDFFPYMGYFYKLFQSDIFVFSDDVQYSKRGRHNYNEILTSNGPLRITLPIHRHVERLDKIQIAAGDEWVAKTLKTFWIEYKRAEYFPEVFSLLEELLPKALATGNLADFNITCLLSIIERFGLERKTILRSSNLNLHDKKDARIIEMCKLLGADVYISGIGAKEYHNEMDYKENNILLLYSDYQPISYPQIGRPATENMSVIDYIMNCGFMLPKGWTRWEK